MRLQKVGKKHEPVFRVVLTDSKNSAKSGRFKEILGSLDQRSKQKPALKADRILYWRFMGATTSDTLHNLLIREGVIKAKKINNLPKKSPTKKRRELVAKK